MNATEANVKVVLESFRAVERRDDDRMQALFHPSAEFHWPPELPYGGSRARGGTEDAPGRTFEDVWDPFQPTEAERGMDPRVIGANDREVAVLWRQRGVGPDGERLDSQVLGLYEVRDGQLARAQMFYFDPRAVTEFLGRAAGRPA
jgi:ketosteroid isomerase-like protein